MTGSLSAVRRRSRQLGHRPDATRAPRISTATEVVHVSGTADVPAIVEDLTQHRRADRAGLPARPRPGSQSLEELGRRAPTIDVYANAEDNTLRQLDLSIDDRRPERRGGTATVGLSIGIADPNSEQEITAPEDAQPIADLLGQIPAARRRSAGSARWAAPGASSGGGGAHPAGAAASDYYDCVARRRERRPTSRPARSCSPLMPSL